MSRDPLEELFGPLDSDEPETGSFETGADAASGEANSEAATQAFEPAPAVRPRAGRAAADPRSDADAPTAAFDAAETGAAPTAAAPTAAAPVGAAPTRAQSQPLTPGGSPAGAPAPAPVRPRIQRPQGAEPPTQPVPADAKRSNSALPWIIVAVVAVLALVGSLLVVNAIGKDDPKPEETTEAPAPTPSETDGQETETAPPEVEEPEEEKAPVVDVGADPLSLPISFANITVETSRKLTNPQWFYHAGPPERVMFESGLMNSFPDSCAAMRSPVGQSPWGIEKGEGDTWEVVRPEGTCAADPDLYNEVWGLMQAVADSVKPL